MQYFQKLRPFFYAILLSALVWFVRPTALIDNIWSDILLVNQKAKATSQILIIDISADDLIVLEKGGHNKKYAAETLEFLYKSGAKRILYDSNFSSAMNSEDELKLVEAFEKLGKTKLAIGYDPNPAFMAKPILTDHATVVDLRLMAERDGRFRGLVYPVDSKAYDPARWLASGLLRSGSTDFDLRVDPKKFDRMTITDLKAPDFNADIIKDRLIIISLNRTVSHSRANLPIYGAENRSTLLALATLARLNDYDKTVTLSHYLVIMLSIASLIIGFLIGQKSPKIKSALFWLSSFIVSIIIISLFFSLTLGGRSAPSMTITIALIGLNMALAHRLRLTELIAGFMAGDLSPEEVWLWRSYSDQEKPVVLFDANGAIKRANPLAMAAFSLDNHSLKNGVTGLAQQCIPSLGKRSKRLSFINGHEFFWQIEWPHPTLPLSVFYDITETVTKEGNLAKRLITDTLTGLLNRAGFEDALKTIDDSARQDYAVFFMDMNGFKMVNDTHGHNAGDELLRLAAKRFASIIRTQDLLARLGGDEFALIVSGHITDEIAKALSEKLEATLDQPVTLENATVKVGVAVGFGLPEDPKELTADVLHRADVAMYARKAVIKMAA